MSTRGPIIVVDDDEDDHYLMKRVCEKLEINTEIIFFTDGHEVFNYLKSTPQKPFIILSDINMPIMNGMELRRKIIDDEELKRKCIPFIFFSTAAMASIVREAFDLAVQGFFIKEQSLAKLEQTVKIIFDYWEKGEQPI